MPPLDTARDPRRHTCDDRSGAETDRSSDARAELKFTFPDHGCFGCSTKNLDGLHLRFFKHGREVRGTYRIAERFHGAPGLAHGGIVATILDEFSCAAAVFLTGKRVMTGELTIRYESPCPVEQDIEIVARITGRDHPRYLVIESEVRRGERRLAVSTGKFFPQAIAEPAP
ncbi:MAG: PaaI family thioesterase [Deltaproteobacteria bacterium]|nr:PaaI family thioesterase [Deltaproteobacteria bacterium]